MAGRPPAGSLGSVHGRLPGEGGEMLAEHTTLTQFLIEERRHHAAASGELNSLILDVAIACKAIANRIAAGALGGALGSADRTNVQGEVQQKLDLIANTYFLRATEWSG